MALVLSGGVFLQGGARLSAGLVDLSGGVAQPTQTGGNYDTNLQGVLFASSGTYAFEAPAGVTSVCVVCVGGGGGGGRYDYSYASGAGGGLGWKNNISVVPGNTYTVVVGGFGASGILNEQAGRNGGNSYFISTSTVAGFGGTAGNGSFGNGNQAGGGYAGDGGGIGGRGQAGAGGAGGYTGNGGDGWVYIYESGGTIYGSQTLPSGGAGAGAGVNFGDTLSNGGGGVGVNGQTATATTASQGGSGGATGGNFYYGISAAYVNGGIGGGYGGGGGGGNSSGTKGGNGAGGAVRIIWGSGRAFPSTNTGNL